jgi:hypothetical protein
MPKKHRKKAGGVVAAGPTSTDKGGSKRRRYYAAALSALVLLAASAAATRYDAVRRAVGLRPMLSALIAQATPTPLPLSKEYIYAGGRLVATEEPTPVATPTPTPAGPPPTDLVATAEFPSAGVANVRLTWNAPPSGPTVVSYVVECMRAGTGFQQIAAVQEPTRTYNDTTVTLDSSYLYRVRAVFSNAGTSLYSNQDLATTVLFTDSHLQGVTIKAVHLTELRRAVAAVRALVGINAPSWTYPDPVSSPASQRRPIYLEDVTDLRARLDEALAPLNLQSPYPVEPLFFRGGAVSAAHFEQIRERVR